MAKARIDTLMALDQFAELLNINPLHFNQVTCAAFPETRDCQSVWYQHGHQTGRGVASREILASTLARAETTIAKYMGFWPAPKYTVGEIAQAPVQKYQPHYPKDTWQTLGLEWHRFLAGGRVAYEVLHENVPVVPVDMDGDGYAEMVEITIPTPATRVEEVTVFPSADVFAGRLDRDRIRNLDTEIEGGNLILRGSLGYFVRPELWSGPRRHFIDGDDPTNFLTHVDIYRRYTTSNAENPPVEFGWQSRNEEGGFRIAHGVLQVYLPAQGVVSLVPSTWDEDEGTWRVNSCWGWRNPDLVRVNYLSGVPLDIGGRVAAPYDRALVALTAATVGTNICVCSPMRSLVDEWQRMPHRDDGPAGAVIVRNPFGPFFGAYEAYQIVSQDQGFGVTSL